MPRWQFFHVGASVSELECLAVLGWLVILLVEVVQAVLLGLLDVLAVFLVDGVAALLRGELVLGSPVGYLCDGAIGVVERVLLVAAVGIGLPASHIFYSIIG